MVTSPTVLPSNGENLPYARGGVVDRLPAVPPRSPRPSPVIRPLPRESPRGRAGARTFSQHAIGRSRCEYIAESGARAYGFFVGLPSTPFVSNFTVHNKQVDPLWHALIWDLQLQHQPTGEVQSWVGGRASVWPRPAGPLRHASVPLLVLRPSVSHSLCSAPAPAPVPVTCTCACRESVCARACSCICLRACMRVCVRLPIVRSV